MLAYRSVRVHSSYRSHSLLAIFLSVTKLGLRIEKKNSHKSVLACSCIEVKAFYKGSEISTRRKQKLIVTYIIPFYTVAYLGEYAAMASPRNVRKIFLTRDTVKNGISNLYILLKCALKMQEMPFQRPKISGKHAPGHPYNCVVTMASPLLKFRLRYCFYTPQTKKIYDFQTMENNPCRTRVQSTMLHRALLRFHDVGV